MENTRASSYTLVQIRGAKNETSSNLSSFIQRVKQQFSEATGSGGRAMNEEQQSVVHREEELEKRGKGKKGALPKSVAAFWKKLFRNKKRVIAFIVALALVAVAASAIIFANLSKKSATSSTLTEVKVTRGNISKTITGSAEVQPAQEYSVVPTVTGKILTDNITQGQIINQGDLLYTIDSTNAENTVKQNENALERARLSYQQAEEAIKNLTVTSDVSGVITKVYIKNGDQVQANASVIEVQNATELTATIPFWSSDVSNMYVGESAQVNVSYVGNCSGTVTRIYSGQQYSSYGGNTTNVDITFKNPGTATAGATATAIVGSYASQTSGTVAYISDTIVTAKTSGQVSGMNFKVGDAVKAGQTVAVLSNDSASVSAQTAKLQYESAQLTLQNAKNALNNCNITSPISGTVIEKNSKAGDTISSTSSSSAMAIIADMSSLVMTINVDELDILNIKVGQTANITADALSGKTFTGEVTSVSSIGTSGSSSSSSSGASSSTGVTTYAVQITIKDYGSLLPGMNANASIVIDSASNVLLIPEQAVVSGSFVMKKIGASDTDSQPSATASASGNAESTESGTSSHTNSQNKMKALQTTLPKGYELVRVQTGLTDGTYAEVKSGLNEGDTVAYRTETTTAKTSSSSSSSGSNKNTFSAIGGTSNGSNGNGGFGGEFSGGGGPNGASTSFKG